MAKQKTFIMKPKVDFCFKELMEDAEIRKGFISALLGIRPEEIERTELRPTHLRREHQEDKLGILDFVLFENDEEFYSCFHMWEDHRRRMYTDKLEIHILELPKLAERSYPETELLNWARFFNAEQKEEFEMVAKTNPYIEKAYERLTEISADEDKQWEYEVRERAIRDHDYLMNLNLEMGWKKGLEKGIEQGAKALIEMCQKLSVSREETCTNLIEKLSLLPETAEKYLEQYWGE